MKKLFAIILATVLCFSLCACGNNDDLVGTWKCENYDIIVTFQKDGNAIYYECGDKEMFEWALNDGVIIFDGYETDFLFEDGKLIMVDGGEVSTFVKK